jgi:serine phosphatase RsbU (regulator of sigma subunit)
LARYTIRAAAIGASSPAAVLGLLNSSVRAELGANGEGSERFMTAALGLVAKVDDAFEIAVACGGHPPPLVVTPGGEVAAACEAGTLLGTFEDVELIDADARLEPGDLLVFYTDGVIEARRDGEEFGEARLYELLAGLGGRSAAEVADALESAVVDFAGGPTGDDVALMVLRRPGV